MHSTLSEQYNVQVALLFTKNIIYCIIDISFPVQVFVALLGCVSASPFLQDTPEVVAERARFVQLWNAQAAAAAAAPDDGFTRNAPAQRYVAQNTNVHVFQSPKWTGPVAATIPAGVQGSAAQVADTAEVTAARNAFLAAYRAQVAATTGQHVAPQFSSHNTGHYTPVQHTFQPAPAFNAIQAAPQKYSGPFAATIPAGVNGQIIPVSDTAEVVAARNAFLAAYNNALAATSPAVQNTNVRSHQYVAQPQPAKYTGPFASTIPAGLPGAGYQVAQTADVAAATAEFTRAYNAAVAATTGRRF